MSKKLTLLSTSLLGATVLLAQQQQDTIKSKSLDEVIVTANKLAQKQSTTGKVVTVINREQIERSGGKDLSQILNEQTGIYVAGANSNPGKDKSIFLRGASSNYTVVLLDGVPLNDPSGVGGAYDLRLLPTEQIERIEILKGSQSTLYGSNAIAGVINIITRKAENTQTSGTGTVSYGSYNTLKGGANVGRSGKILDYNLGYQYTSTDGIAEGKDTTGKGNFAKNGVVQQAFQANVGINVNSKLKLSPYYRYSEFKGTYANAFAGGSSPFDATLVNTGLIARYNYNKGSINANSGYDLTNRTYSFATYKGKFFHGEAYVNHRFSNTVQLVAGANYQSFRLEGADAENSLVSPYASLLFAKSGFNVELGSRYNYHNRYGSNVTYSFNPSYLISNTVKIFANLSSGFRAPSINEMFGPFGANADLKPEKSTNIEGGFQAWLVNKKLSVSGTYFDRNLTDAIIYATKYLNRDKQHDHGFEAEVSYIPTAKWNLKATYAYVTGTGTQILTTGDKTVEGLIRRPKNSVNLFAGYQLTRNFFISSSLQAIGKRDDVHFPPPTYSQQTVSLEAYTLWNMYAEYRCTDKSFSIFIDAKNLTDKTDYYEAYGYNVQGFNVTGGIRFKL